MKKAPDGPFRCLTWGVRIFSVVAALLLILSAFQYNTSPQENPPLSLERGWSMSEDEGKRIQNVTLPLRASRQDLETIDLYHTLPEKVYPVEAMTLSVFQKSVWVYVEGEELYAYEFQPSALHQNDPGSGNITVTLPADSAGKELHIRYRLDNHMDESYLQPPKIIDGAATGKGLGINDTIILATMSYFVFTALLLVVKFFLQNPLLSKNKSDLALSLFFLSMATWVLCYNKLTNLIISNWVLVHNLEYICFYIIPYAVWCYISLSWNSSSRIIRFARCVMGLFFTCAISLKLFFQVDFVALLPVFHILIVANVVLLLWELGRNYKNKPLSYRLFAVGMWIVIAAVLLALVQQYFLLGQLTFSVFFVSGIALGGVLQALSIFCLANEDQSMRFHSTFMLNLNNEYSRYETIFSNTGDVFIDWDSEQDTAFLSSNFEEYFGISGKHQSFTKYFRNNLQLLNISGGTVDPSPLLKKESVHEHTECSFRHPQGETKWFSLDLFSSLNSNGENTHVVGIVKDITEQKQLELKYAAQKQYNHINNLMYDNVLEADMSQNLLIGEKARQLTETLGLEQNASYDDIIHAIQQKITHPDYMEAYGEALSRERIL